MDGTDRWEDKGKAIAETEEEQEEQEEQTGQARKDSHLHSPEDDASAAAEPSCPVSGSVGAGPSSPCGYPRVHAPEEYTNVAGASCPMSAAVAASSSPCRYAHLRPQQQQEEEGGTSAFDPILQSVGDARPSEACGYESTGSSCLEWDQDELPDSDETTDDETLGWTPRQHLDAHFRARTLGYAPYEKENIWKSPPRLLPRRVAPAPPPPEYEVPFYGHPPEGTGTDLHWRAQVMALWRNLEPGQGCRYSGSFFAPIKENQTRPCKYGWGKMLVEHEVWCGLPRAMNNSLESIAEAHRRHHRQQGTRWFEGPVLVVDPPDATGNDERDINRRYWVTAPHIFRV